MKDKICMKGEFFIQAVEAETGKVIKTWSLKNLLTEVNQNVRVEMLLGTYSGTVEDLAIKYFAFGTGTGTPSVTDTQLFNEVYRKQVTQVSNPSQGIVQSVCSLGSQEANYNLTEIGVFCGPNASSLPSTGTMISHIMFSFSKNTNVVLNILRTDTCTIN